MRLERCQQALTVLVALLLGRYRAGRRRGAVQIVDVQVHDAHLGRRTHAVAGLRGETDDPWARVVHVDLRIARVHRRKSDPAPPTQFNEVFDSVYGDAEYCGVPREEQNPTRRCEGNL